MKKTSCMFRFKLFVVATMVLFFAATSPVADEGKPSQKELTELAAEAFVYGYSLVYNVEEFYKGTVKGELMFSAPINVFGNVDKLADHTVKFVSINNDSLYAVTFADLSDGPMVVSAPTWDKYWVIQFVDLYTNNFAYIGTRATGGDAQKYLLAGPGWSGTPPEGMRVIKAPTDLVTLVGRWQADGDEEIASLVKAREELYLSPLDIYPERPDTSRRVFGDWEFAPYNQRVKDELVWWEKFRTWSQMYPPAAPDLEYTKKFEVLGIFESHSPYLNPSPELEQALIDGANMGMERIMGNIRKLVTNPEWIEIIHLFDYNRYFFEIGTDAGPEWIISDFEEAMAKRSLTTRIGLYGNHGYEAAYYVSFLDEEGQPLDGANTYELTIVPPPLKEKGFWSLTMYDMPYFYLVENPIGRYSIGDRTKGVKYNEDGSITIYIQRDNPGPDKESNWLPAPKGRFRPAMRLYLPTEQILDGTYKMQMIKKTGSQTSG